MQLLTLGSLLFKQSPKQIGEYILAHGYWNEKTISVLISYFLRGYFRGCFIFTNIASQTSRKFPLQFMSILQ